MINKDFMITLSAFIVVGSAIFFVVSVIEKGDYNPEKYFLSERALTADYHLAVARNEFIHARLEQTAKEINKVVSDLRFIESITDAEGIGFVEKAIADLMEVEKEIKSGELKLVQLEKASLESLNTMSYVHLKLADQFTKNREPKKATRSLQIAIKHLQNANKLASRDSLKADEGAVIDELNALLLGLENNGRLEEKEFVLSASSLLRLISNEQ